MNEMLNLMKKSEKLAPKMFLDRETQLFDMGRRETGIPVETTF